jgi:probable phosphoglycerate mutase
VSIVLVRHGETEWSASGKHTGVSDVPLIEAGRRVAGALRDRLAGREFALVLSSPRERARVTAGLAGFDEPELDDDLVEVDYGDYEGLTTPEIRVERPGWSIWEHGAPGGETVDDAGRRADRVIERAVAVDGDVLVFAHGHLLRILAARWLGEPAAFGGRLRLDTATVSVLGHERETPVVLRWNTR